jgi:outer membrane protein OmpA-like peptidoglycan-associated protein
MKLLNMKQFILIVFLGLSIPVLTFSQANPVQNASIPKDAPIDVTVSDFKNNLKANEIIVFKSQINSKEYQGLTDDNGKFSIRLPAGDKYEIFILGFKDSTSYNILDIPATTGNAYYKNAFKVDIQFQPSKTFVLDDCNFETGKATLQPESYSVLDELVAYLVRKDDEKIELGGHTDNVGSAASNLKLSLDRANTVRAYLLTKGIDPDRVTAKGYGMSEPIADNKSEEGRALNRRTEVKILGN